MARQVQAPMEAIQDFAISAIEGGSVLVDVAGIAYEVEVSAGVLQTLPRVGEEMRLHTHFVVREDAQLLYGFASKSERELFRAFIKISGVGPKLAAKLADYGVHRVEDLLFHLPPLFAGSVSLEHPSFCYGAARMLTS